MRTEGGKPTMTKPTADNLSANSASAPVAMAYWEGWNNAPVPDLSFRLSLAFAAVQGDGSPGAPYWTDYSGSLNFQQPGAPGTPFYTWASWLYQHGGGCGSAIPLVSYGGGTETALRKLIINNSYLDNLAGEMIANLVRWRFSGLDLDIEDWWNHSPQENQQFATNLTTVVKTMGQKLLSGTPITITVGTQSAGSLPFINDDKYTGTMAPFFKDAEAMGYVDRVNIMTYNIGVSNLYSDLAVIGTILNTYTALGVPASKLCIGISPEQNGEPAVALTTVTNLAAYLKQNGYGGAFLWAIGEKYGTGAPSATDYMNAIIQGFGQT
jgi:chitinase